MKAYQFIDKYHDEFGIRWLLRRLKISSNSYYNYKKNIKKVHKDETEKIKSEIQEIYHEHNGVPGHRTVIYLLRNRGINRSKTTIHKYMNKQLGLKSIIRKKKPKYIKGEINKVFPNELKREFDVESKNLKWCVDFTYIFLVNGQKRYNCTIIDLFDRSVIASHNGKEITSKLAINTLKQAFEKHHIGKNGVMLHSDQGAQFTSKEFTEFCSTMNIKQSMSHAGCPYDNAPMERYYNTLKNELVNLHNYHNDNELNESIKKFSVWYNCGRPHSYNNELTPYQARAKST